MDYTIIIALISLIVTLTSVITSFILQFEKNTIKKVRENNNKLITKIQKLSDVIIAYIQIEEKFVVPVE